MRAPSRGLRVLLCTALLGVLLVLGLAAGLWLGPVGAALYAIVAVALVLAAVVAGRRALAPVPLPPGRSCTCCTTSQHDPVTII